MASLPYTPLTSGTVLILPEFAESVAVERFSEPLGSTTQLAAAVAGATAVVNAADWQDLRLLPDAGKLQAVNEGLAAALAAAVAAAGGVKRVVQLSSLLVGASFMGPSVFPTELSTRLPSPCFAVFPAYVRAKRAAEAVWADFRPLPLPCPSSTASLLGIVEDLTVFTLRLPMVYGEGDEDSFIMDVLRYCQAHGGTCTLIKRPHGKIQV